MRFRWLLVLALALLPIGSGFTQDPIGANRRLSNLAQPDAAQHVNHVLNNLRRAAARSRLNNPRDNAVMASPPTIAASHLWATATAYTVGQYAVKGTNRYIATQSGTSGSPGPSGTGTGIVDGSVIWNFVDNLHTAAFSTAAENSYLWSTPTVAGGGARKEVFNYYGGVRTNASGGGVNYAKMLSVTVNGVLTSGPQRVEFVADSAKFVCRVSEAGSTSGFYRLIVDGQFASLTAVTPPHAGFNYLVVDFTAAGGRKPRNIIIELGGASTFGGCDVLITEGIYNPGGDAIIKAAVTGDSYAASGGIANSSDGWHIVMSDLLGLRNMESTAIGGTGLLTSSSSGTAITRVSDITNFAPDVVFIILGGNDTAFTQAQITAALVAYVQAIRAVPATAKSVIFVFGIMRGNYSPDMTAAVAAEQALQSGVTQLAQSGDKLTFFLPVATDPNGGWLTGTGNTTTPNGTGNDDVYISTDLVHPNEAGHVFLGHRAADAVQRFLAAQGY